MALPGLLLNFGLKHLFDLASKEAADWLDSRFDDRSRAAPRAVLEANRRAWAVVAAALAERTFWGRVKGLADEADFRAARRAAGDLFALLPADTRARAAAELEAVAERLRDQAPGSADDADALRRFSSPADLVAAADRAAADLPDGLSDEPNLRSALQFRPDGAVGLFHTFYRYYFRKGVQGNPALASQLAADQLRAVTETLSAQTLVTAADQLHVLFVDAAHVVFGTYLCGLWSILRVFVRAASGRQRFNVPGAWDAVARTLLTVTNTTVVNTDTMCALLRAVAARGYAGPVTPVLDNARYQRNDAVKGRAKELGIELLFRPSYSPNRNLIERLWRFTKRTAIDGKYHPTFADFRAAVQDVLDRIPTNHADKLASLMTPKFQELEDVSLLAA